MTFTLLLDLDDTLLEANMATFFPAYLQALSAALSHLVPPETMLPALMSGTKRMMENLDPALTLREVFDAYFFKKLGMERDSLQATIDNFYDEVFPNLGSLTKARPEAIRLVDWAFEQGYRVAIATNPLFPLKAIQHRLRWAGLPPERYPFALVSSYESFHFTKESVAYFDEVMGQMGWPEDPVVMVGNDMDMDLRPAQQAGFPVFWVKNGDEISPEFAAIPQGRLEEFRNWLEGVDPQALQLSYNSPQALLALLRSTPAALASLTRDLSAPAWTRSPKPDEWCLTEIIGHLRDVDRDVNLPRLRKVLAEENPFIAGEVTDVWVKERQYARQDGRTSLAEFTAVRKELLALLGGLQTEWNRPARHAIFGPTDLQELVGFIAEHDRAHVKQALEAIK
jgi:FMN phosphatase YigB (HAD superfamily)